ncbi:hypothetical protein BDV38DRAFT_251361 [Aspergillus pseudotamarii]|uniref:Uncharacterized protein n=1 Tax=Aspergillus pseudotamarii TaxID=132259 RepID=A0A5N6SPN3_ASPPS|nr:uncharacterized protein BDV38DRAFT_251361 [Aspergillus pseudotamarii]KAE8135730.1 hypothetical protein BDV38DRAFT_251361 [Aspergillus pseudotamarii]
MNGICRISVVMYSEKIPQVQFGTVLYSTIPIGSILPSYLQVLRPYSGLKETCQ